MTILRTRLVWIVAAIAFSGFLPLAESQQKLVYTNYTVGCDANDNSTCAYTESTTPTDACTSKKNLTDCTLYGDWKKVYYMVDSSAAGKNLTAKTASKYETDEKITVEYNYFASGTLPNCTNVKSGNKKCNSCTFCTFSFTINSDGTDVDVTDVTLTADCSNVKYGRNLTCSAYSPVFYPLEVRKAHAIQQVNEHSSIAYLVLTFLSLFQFRRAWQRVPRVARQSKTIDAALITVTRKSVPRLRRRKSRQSQTQSLASQNRNRASRKK
jgi:hypothetical protein